MDDFREVFALCQGLSTKTASFPRHGGVSPFRRARVLQQLEAKPTDLERYIHLISLVDNNETLFYKVVMSDTARFLPIVYDPTIGEACLKFRHIFRRPRGV